MAADMMQWGDDLDKLGLSVVAKSLAAQDEMIKDVDMK